MSTTIETMIPEKYKNVFAHAPTFTGDVSWLRTLRTKAYKRFQELGFPTRKHEDWRYINLEPILETAFVRPEDIVPHVDQEILQEYILSADNPRLVLVNGRYFEEGSSLGTLPDRVLFEPLHKALTTHGTRVELAISSSI